MKAEDIQKLLEDSNKLEQKVAQARPNVREEAFIPLSLARGKIQEIIRDFHQMKSEYVQIVADIEKNYRKIEDETTEFYTDFIAKLKRKGLPCPTDRAAKDKAQIDALKQEVAAVKAQAKADKERFEKQIKEMQQAREQMERDHIAEVERLQKDKEHDVAALNETMTKISAAAVRERNQAAEEHARALDDLEQELTQRNEGILALAHAAMVLRDEEALAMATIMGDEVQATIDECDIVPVQEELDKTRAALESALAISFHQLVGTAMAGQLRTSEQHVARLAKEADEKKIALNDVARLKLQLSAAAAATDRMRQQVAALVSAGALRKPSAAPAAPAEGAPPTGLPAAAAAATGTAAAVGASGAAGAEESAEAADLASPPPIMGVEEPDRLAALPPGRLEVETAAMLMGGVDPALLAEANAQTEQARTRINELEGQLKEAADRLAKAEADAARAQQAAAAEATQLQEALALKSAALVAADEAASGTAAQWQERYAKREAELMAECDKARAELVDAIKARRPSPCDDAPGWADGRWWGARIRLRKQAEKAEAEERERKRKERQDRLLQLTLDLKAAVTAKNRVKREIQAWLDVFEQQNGRKAEKADKATIRDKYELYQKLSDEIAAGKTELASLGQSEAETAGPPAAPHTHTLRPVPPRPASSRDLGRAVMAAAVEAEELTPAQELAKLQGDLIAKQEEVTRTAREAADRLAAAEQQRAAAAKEATLLREERDALTLQTQRLKSAADQAAAEAARSAETISRLEEDTKHLRRDLEVRPAEAINLLAAKDAALAENVVVVPQRVVAKVETLRAHVEALRAERKEARPPTARIHGHPGILVASPWA
ncbi:hypothetical protein PAPYR_4883 [Paratrimastix pyriformis]|uniref:Uncharacterized protein n=1 Tax=Paratrimastix pyriformis TaxID=342808 RepID=A0ABQ8UP36_9EUKA|nr:hypothetical protein PAPYR_4883 [Paratrimastix pyriformis]